MTGILDKFSVEHGAHGSKVVARSSYLTSTCTSESEVDTAIEMLKDDLDAFAKGMKRVMKVNRPSIFEGWPSRD